CAADDGPGGPQARQPARRHRADTRRRPSHEADFAAQVLCRHCKTSPLYALSRALVIVRARQGPSQRQGTLDTVRHARPELLSLGPFIWIYVSADPASDELLIRT